ncbi:H-type lectin domain-containing protein [Qipengyuania sp. S6317L1]|uniref:H-type lectin domain-containing protein n=1 Tax=Qipengyuania sp. S6317L1 TaxID=2926410 RepID=UPI001FF45439|nr:H-type lectin domain-containing protein [Qipengyuania sp. S6317L1]MCK0098033.1 H-type lectin domain-containing protein [Qipengyuania sp. S6317L1]
MRTLTFGASLAGAFIFLCSLLPAPAQAGRLEAGTFTAHDTLGSNRTPDFVPFQEQFDVPPVVVAISDSSGNNSASIRITNVTTTGFDELILEPDNWDGRHVAQPVQYIAVEPGRHLLSDGTIIEAGFVELNNVQFGTGFSGGVASWRTVNFAGPMNGAPIILHQLQTANSETRNVANDSSRPHITSIAQSASSTGFQLAIERSQANSGPFPTTERIGWIAIQSGQNASFPDTAGTTINWSTRISPATIRGWDNGCSGVSHGVSGSANPIVIAKKTTRNNGDGGWLRYCAINSANITLRVDEDRDQDNERGVAAGDAESASIIAFSQSFHANLRADLGVTKVNTGAVNANGTDFNVPGASVSYLITVFNAGNAPPAEGSVFVTEALPERLALILADFGTAGSGPIEFTDGSPATNVSCPFAGFASTSDCYSFSTDGNDFTYVPSDSGDGTDPNVRFIRIQPTGIMSAQLGSGPPNFELRLSARIR